MKTNKKIKAVKRQPPKPRKLPRKIRFVVQVDTQNQ